MKLKKLLSRPLRAHAARQWAALSHALRQDAAPLPDARLRNEARALSRDLAIILQHSDPRSFRDGFRDGATLAAMALPAGTDWRWRPSLFCGAATTPALIAPESGQQLGHEIALWHDDDASPALILRQRQNARAADLAPFGLRLEAFGFEGSYLSLSLDLPGDVPQGLSTNHILRVEADLGFEAPVTGYARLNISQGPNVAQIVQKLTDPAMTDSARRYVEFDLAHADLTPRPVDKLWLDLIFEAPRMTVIDLHDLVLSRHMRADI